MPSSSCWSHDEMEMIIQGMIGLYQGELKKGSEHLPLDRADAFHDKTSLRKWLHKAFQFLGGRTERNKENIYKQYQTIYKLYTSRLPTDETQHPAQQRPAKARALPKRVVDFVNEKQSLLNQLEEIIWENSKISSTPLPLNLVAPPEKQSVTDEDLEKHKKGFFFLYPSLFFFPIHSFFVSVLSAKRKRATPTHGAEVLAEAMNRSTTTRLEMFQQSQKARDKMSRQVLALENEKLKAWQLVCSSFPLFLLSFSLFECQFCSKINYSSKPTKGLWLLILFRPNLNLLTHFLLLLIFHLLILLHL